MLLSWLPFTAPAVAVVASAATGGGLEVYGPMGIILMGLAYFTREIIKGVIARADRSDERLERFIDQFMTECIPVFHQNIQMLEQRENLDRQIIEALRRIQPG